MREKGGPRRTKDLASTRIMDEARAAQDDGTFRHKLPNFLAQLQAGYVTNDERERIHITGWHPMSESC